MSRLTQRDVDYHDADTHMTGLLCAPAGPKSLPTVLLVHDAFGLSDEMIGHAIRLAGLGYAVFAADVWGERFVLPSPAGIGAAVGAMARDREAWHSRLLAAQAAAAAQPEIDGDRIVAMGFCFGGSSALELLRIGSGIIGAVSIHGGLDLVQSEWREAAAGGSVLICTGADDPVATAEQRDALQRQLTGASVDWEVDLYSDTRHAFTSPSSAFGPQDVVGFNARSTARAWSTTERFLAETLASNPPSKETP